MPQVIEMEKQHAGKTWAMARSRFGRTAAKVGIAVVATTSAMAAKAQEAGGSILPSDFSGSMDAVGGDITTVGGALIGLAVIAVGIKWVKATFFG